ncbi:MAG: hypothetical protein ACKO8I_14570 [Cyanobacteriota bacterium]
MLPRPSPVAPGHPPAPAPLAAVLGLIGAALVGPPPGLAQGHLAQVQQFILGPGSSVGPETKVVPKDCVTAPDGAITCSTQLVNPPSSTEAKPQYSPWDK